MDLLSISCTEVSYSVWSCKAAKDIELLPGQAVDVEELPDDNFGQLLDLLYEANTSHLYSELAMNALRVFDVATKHLHAESNSSRIRSHSGLMMLDASIRQY